MPKKESDKQEVVSVDEKQGDEKQAKKKKSPSKEAVAAVKALQEESHKNVHGKIKPVAAAAPTGDAMSSPQELKHAPEDLCIEAIKARVKETALNKLGCILEGDSKHTKQVVKLSEDMIVVEDPTFHVLVSGSTGQKLEKKERNASMSLGVDIGSAWFGSAGFGIGGASDHSSTHDSSSTVIVMCASCTVHLKNSDDVCCASEMGEKSGFRYIYSGAVTAGFSAVIKNRKCDKSDLSRRAVDVKFSALQELLQSKAEYASSGSKQEDSENLTICLEGIGGFGEQPITWENISSADFKIQLNEQLSNFYQQYRAGKFAGRFVYSEEDAPLFVRDKDVSSLRGLITGIMAKMEALLSPGKDDALASLMLLRSKLDRDLSTTNAKLIAKEFARLLGKFDSNALCFEGERYSILTKNGKYLSPDLRGGGLVEQEAPYDFVFKRQKDGFEIFDPETKKTLVSEDNLSFSRAPNQKWLADAESPEKKKKGFQVSREWHFLQYGNTKEELRFYYIMNDSFGLRVRDFLGGDTVTASQVEFFPIMDEVEGGIFYVAGKFFRNFISELQTLYPDIEWKQPTISFPKEVGDEGWRGTDAMLSRHDYVGVVRLVKQILPRVLKMDQTIPATYIIGPAEAGKSMFVDYMLGHTFHLQNDKGAGQPTTVQGASQTFNPDAFDPVAAGYSIHGAPAPRQWVVDDPAKEHAEFGYSGNEGLSKYPAQYQDLIDCPGSESLPGGRINQFNSFVLSVTREIAPAKAILVMVPAQNFGQERERLIETLVSYISNLVTNYEVVKDKLIFVYNIKGSINSQEDYMEWLEIIRRGLESLKESYSVDPDVRRLHELSFSQGGLVAAASRKVKEIYSGRKAAEELMFNLETLSKYKIWLLVSLMYDNLFKKGQYYFYHDPNSPGLREGKLKERFKSLQQPIDKGVFAHSISSEENGQILKLLVNWLFLISQPLTKAKQKLADLEDEYVSRCDELGKTSVDKILSRIGNEKSKEGVLAKITFLFEKLDEFLYTDVPYHDIMTGDIGRCGFFLLYSETATQAYNGMAPVCEPHHSQVIVSHPNFTLYEEDKASGIARYQSDTRSFWWANLGEGISTGGMFKGPKIYSEHETGNFLNLWYGLEQFCAVELVRFKELISWLEQARHPESLRTAWQSVGTQIAQMECPSKSYLDRFAKDEKELKLRGEAASIMHDKLRELKVKMEALRNIVCGLPPGERQHITDVYDEHCRIVSSNPDRYVGRQELTAQYEKEKSEILSFLTKRRSDDQEIYVVIKRLQGILLEKGNHSFDFFCELCEELHGFSRAAAPAPVNLSHNPAALHHAVAGEVEADTASKEEIALVQPTHSNG